LVLISSSILGVPVCQLVRCLVQKRLGGLGFEAMMMHVEPALLQSGSGFAGCTSRLEAKTRIQDWDC
jgi:hypothetical protein